MKKIMLITLIILTGIFTVGCNDEEKAEPAYMIERADLMNDNIKEATNNSDSKALVSMFSETSQNQIKDLDGQAKAFIKAFDGKRITDIKGSEPYYSGAYYAQPFSIFGWYDITLDSGENYRMFINFCDMDDKNPENVGLNMIIVWNCPYKTLPDEYDHRKVNVDNNGIYFFEIM